MEVGAPIDTMLDVAFPIEGLHLARDHGLALSRALTDALPWLGQEPAAGIHRVKVVPGYGARGLLSQRARLILRVPAARADDLAALAGRVLDVGGCSLRLGAPRPRELLAHGTLFAAFVAARSDDEAGFMGSVAAALQALRVDARSICGRRGSVGAAGGPIPGFSLMLHGLSTADSVRVQCAGIGPNRLLGCGLFVPHRSAAAVGT